MSRDHSRSLIKLTGALGALSLACGCGAQNSAACANLCEKLELCDSGTDELECRESCESDQGYRPEYWEYRSTCATELSCTELGGATEIECLADATKDLTLTTSAGSLCEEMGAMLRSCDGDVDDVAAMDACAGTAQIYSEPFSEALRGCYQESCNDIRRCLGETSEEFQVSPLLDVFSPDDAPIVTWTPANLFARLDLARAEACVCSGSCEVAGRAPAELLECYQGVYAANPDAYQVALDCHGDVARELEACNREAVTEHAFAECVALENAMNAGCPSYDELFEVCGTCTGTECAELPRFSCE